MKKLTIAICALACFGANAAQPSAENDNSFSCMDKSTFEINSSCMSTKIENNDSFLATQNTLFEQSANTDNAMATMTINPKTLDIEIVAHKDAYLARLEKLNNQ
uniref:pyridine nucleotide transhydrogenase n=1 Tax=Ningiella ruwaisensis TaxID=2364274 RepID=UPI00109FA357|nr:pyridine nucleotide transhydrogenase [Ningiella ruwaisensis]